MKKLLIDISIIEAFFNKNNINHIEALSIVRNLNTTDKYSLFVNVVDVNNLVVNFAKKINSAKNKKLLSQSFKAEKMILDNLNVFISNLKIKSLSISSFDTLKQAEFYQKKYSLTYDTSVTYTIMKQNEIEYVLSINKNFANLINEGLIDSPKF